MSVKRITIKDIAREAGCSWSTVSKLINGGNVKEPQKSLIADIIQKLDYKPNSFAKYLRSQKSNTIGVVVPEFDNYFSMSLIKAIESELNQFNYSVIAVSSDGKAEKETVKLRFLMEKRVDGIIMIPCSENGTHIRLTVKNLVPLVLIDRRCEDLDSDVILLNNREVSQKATKILLEKADNVAIIGTEESFTGRERSFGYRDSIEMSGKTIRPEYVRDGRNTMDGGFIQMMQLWKLSEHPSGLFVTNYEMTVGAIMAVNALGICVPDELRIIGFDNIDLAKVFNCHIPIVAQPMKDMGKRAAGLILDRIHNRIPDKPQSIVFKASLDNLNTESKCG